MSLFALSYADQTKRQPMDTLKTQEGYSRLGVSWEELNRSKQQRKDFDPTVHSLESSPEAPKAKASIIATRDSFLANPVSEWESRHKLMEAEYRSYLQNSYKSRPKSRTPEPPPVANRTIGRRNREVQVRDLYIGEVERRRKEVLQEPHDQIYFPFGKPGGGAPLRDPKTRILGSNYTDPPPMAEPEKHARTVEVSPTRITSYMTPAELERKARAQEEMRKLLDEQIEERNWRVSEEKRGRLLEEQMEEERLARQRQEIEEEYRRELLSREGYSQSPPPPVVQSEKLPSKAAPPVRRPEPQTDPPVRKPRQYEPSKYVSKPFVSDERVQRLRDDMAGRQQTLQDLIMKLKEESQGLAIQKLDALRDFDQMRESINTRNQQMEHYYRQQNLGSHYHTGPWREPFHGRIQQESRFFPMARAGQSVVAGMNLAPTPSFKTMPGERSKEYNGVDSPDVKLQLNKLDSILDYCRGVGDLQVDPGLQHTVDELREAEKDMDERQSGGSRARVDVEESAKFPSEQL